MAKLKNSYLFDNDSELLRYLFHGTREVEGWLSLPEALLLWDLARTAVDHEALVEIGSWKGRSTIWLAWGSKSMGEEKIVSTDPHTGSKEHQRASGPVWTYNEFIQNSEIARLKIGWFLSFLGLKNRLDIAPEVYASSSLMVLTTTKTPGRISYVL